MKFSQRIGITPIKTELEKEGLSKELRNSLWSAFLEYIIGIKSNDIYDTYGRPLNYSPLAAFFRGIWIHFYKHPIDTLPIKNGRAQDSTVTFIRDWFFKSDWVLVFDFIEFCSKEEDVFQDICNAFLKREMSAYRFVNGILVEINSKEEISEIDAAIKNSDKFKSVKQHLKRALELYSDRKSPDYRNSIKESISAVESLASIIVGDTKITLGQALKKIEEKHQIPGSLKSAFTALYGYTSQEGGIRHSLLEDAVKIEIEEARFMLIACSAFVNYLISKM